MGNNMSRMSYGGAGIALAATLVIAFVLCAIVQAIAPGVAFAHQWLALFTTAPIGSVQAWIEGVIASVAVGLVLGHAFAFVYNWVAGRT